MSSTNGTTSSNKILICAIMQSFRPLADKSYNITFNILEPSEHQYLVLRKLHQQPGFLMFKDSEVLKDEQEVFNGLEADLYDDRKSPSQRLRAVLYLFWKKDNKGHEKFDPFYKEYMEKVITHYKNLLD